MAKSLPDPEDPDGELDVYQKLRKKLNDYFIPKRDKHYARYIFLKMRPDMVVGNPIGKKTLIFTFDGKIEYISLPMLILFIDMWQNTYGWMPSL